MKKLILIIVLLMSASIFAQSGSSDILYLLRGSDFNDAGGSLYAYGGSGLYESGGLALRVTPPAPFTLTQTGAQVQDILNGSFDSDVNLSSAIGRKLNIGEGYIQQGANWWERMWFGTEGDSSWITFRNGVRIQDTSGTAFNVGLIITKGVNIDASSSAWVQGITPSTYSILNAGNHTGSVIGNRNEAHITGSGGTFAGEMIGQNIELFQGRADTLGGTWFGNRNRVVGFPSGGKISGNYYGFYSDIDITGVGNSMYHFYGEQDYPSYFGGSVNSSAGYNYSADTSSTDAYKIVLSGAHTLTAGLEVTFKAVTANTDGATLTVNSLTAKALTKAGTTASDALVTGDIVAGQIVKAVYDGTQFQVISRLAQ